MWHPTFPNMTYSSYFTPLLTLWHYAILASPYSLLSLPLSALIHGSTRSCLVSTHSNSNKVHIYTCYFSHSFSLVFWFWEYLIMWSDMCVEDVTWWSSMEANQRSWHLGCSSHLFLTSNLWEMRFLEVGIPLLFAPLLEMLIGSPSPLFKGTLFLVLTSNIVDLWHFPIVLIESLMIGLGLVLL